MTVRRRGGAGESFVRATMGRPRGPIACDFGVGPRCVKDAGAQALSLVAAIAVDCGYSGAALTRAARTYIIEQTRRLFFGGSIHARP